MPLSPGARIVTAPLPRTLDDVYVTDDGCRGCATWTWSPGSGCGGAESRAAASICGSGREAGRARYCPLLPGKKRGGRAGRTSSSMCRECREGQRGNSRLRRDYSTVRRGPTRLEKSTLYGAWRATFAEKYGCRSPRQREVAQVSAKPIEDERTLAADAACQMLRNPSSASFGILSMLSGTCRRRALVGERTWLRAQ